LAISVPSLETPSSRISNSRPSLSVGVELIRFATSHALFLDLFRLKLIKRSSLCDGNMLSIRIQGGNLADVRANPIYHVAENVVNAVEIGFESRQFVSRSDRLGGDAQIEIYVRVDPNQELLQNGRRRRAGRLKGCNPALARNLAGAKTLERPSVAIGKRDVELFHPRAVFKETRGDSFLNFDCDVSIKRGEVSEPASILTRAQDYLVEFNEDFINGLRRHGGTPLLQLSWFELHQVFPDNNAPFEMFAHTFRPLLVGD
jgi:hypothetical protein